VRREGCTGAMRYTQHTREEVEGGGRFRRLGFRHCGVAEGSSLEPGEVGRRLVCCLYFMALRLEQ
jgi:hypothetical protein